MRQLSLTLGMRLVSVLVLATLGWPNGLGMAQNLEGCSTGRLYLGSLSESYAELIPVTGIYQSLDGVTYNDHPVYRHTLIPKQHIYFLSGSQSGVGFWAVSTEVGSSEKVQMIVPSNGHSPNLAQQKWVIRNTGDGSWSVVNYFKAVCVDRDFAPCTSGRVLLSGISGRHIKQLRRMGVYIITNRTYSLRPVYKHEGQNEFLFYTGEVSGQWIIGPEVGKIFGGMFVLDFALRPEFIFQTWVVSTGKYLAHDSGVKLRCHGVSLSGTPSTKNESEIPEVVPLNGQEGAEEVDTAHLHLETDETPADGLQSEATNQETNADEVLEETTCDSTCQNGGRCQYSQENIYFCICNRQYFGITCNLDIDCGDPPPPSSLNGHLTIATTGHYFLDVVFYRCPVNKILDGAPGVICQADGTWSEPPKCLNNHQFITPFYDDDIGFPRRNHS